MQKKISQALQSMDRFSFNETITLNRKVSTVSSNMGAICTFIMLLIVGAFSLLKLNNLIS